MAISPNPKPINMRVIYVLILLFSVNSFSQIASDFTKYKEEHPNSHSVRLNQESKITIALVKGELSITQEIIEEDLFLDKSATYGSNQALNFSSFYEMEKIEASSYILQGEKYVEMKVEDFKEKDELDNSFYDDTKSINFIYPNLDQGAKTKLKYSQKIKNPRFLNAFFFGNFYPIINNKLTLIADKNVELIFQEFNTDSIPIVFSKSENRKNNIYTWELKNIDEFEFEENSPTYKSILPHIIPRISSYNIDGQRKNVLNDVSDLYGWYYSLVENINKEANNQELVNLVESLTKDKANDLEKVRAIYYWTQENIKYIAFEYALGGFVPREANDVFYKKYGDCKDNSSILYKMLEIAGIKGNLTWIGTRSIPYSYNEVPTPIVDNHMILSFEHEGKTYFLDATGRYTSIEAPTSFIQGKEALVAKNSDSFEIKSVPVIEPEQNSYKEHSTIELNGNNIQGKSTTEISGYIKTDFFYDLEKKNSVIKTVEYYNSMLKKGNNSFLVENLVENNKFDYDKNLILNYDFNISNHAKVFGDEIYINLNLNKRLLKLKTKENRKNPIEFEYKDYYEYSTTFDIPKGYSVTYLPKNVKVTNEYISCLIQYDIVNDQIQYQHTILLNSLKLDLKAQKKVNELIDQIEQDYKEVVVLEKQ